MKKIYNSPEVSSLNFTPEDIVSVSLNTLDDSQPWKQDVQWDLNLSVQ